MIKFYVEPFIFVMLQIDWTRGQSVILGVTRLERAYTYLDIMFSSSLMVIAMTVIPKIFHDMVFNFKLESFHL